MSEPPSPAAFEAGGAARSFFKPAAGVGVGDPELWRIQVEIDGRKYRFYIGGAGPGAPKAFSRARFEKTPLYRNAFPSTLFLDMRCLEDQPSEPAQAKSNYELIARASEVARRHWTAIGDGLTVCFFCVSGHNRSVATSVFFAISAWLLALRESSPGPGEKRKRPPLPPLFSLLEGSDVKYQERFRALRESESFAAFALSFVALLPPEPFSPSKAPPFRALPKWVAQRVAPSASLRRTDDFDYFGGWKGHPHHKDIVRAADSHLAAVLTEGTVPAVPPPPPALPFRAMSRQG